MNRDRANRVVDTGDTVKKFHRKYTQYAGDQSDDRCTVKINTSINAINAKKINSTNRNPSISVPPIYQILYTDTFPL